MASLGMSWVGLLRVCNSHGGSARPSKHPRPAVVLSQGATNMVIHCAQISAFVDYCSLSEHLHIAPECKRKSERGKTDHLARWVR